MPPSYWPRVKRRKKSWSNWRSVSPTSCCTGGAGNDLFAGDVLDNRFDGGAGSDTVTYAGIADALTINLLTESAK